MTEITINTCKKCLSKYMYVCTNCGMGGCAKEGCEYQGVHYKQGGIFSSSGGVCKRCGKMTKEV